MAECPECGGRISPALLPLQGGDVRIPCRWCHALLTWPRWLWWSRNIVTLAVMAASGGYLVKRLLESKNLIWLFDLAIVWVAILILAWLAGILLPLLTVKPRGALDRPRPAPKGRAATGG